MSLTKPSEIEKKQWKEQYQADLVRYANRLETADISVLPENVQNMIILFLSRWTATRELEVRIPLAEFRQRMHLTKQRNDYIKNLCKSTYGASAVELNYPDGSFTVTSLIDKIGFKNDYKAPYVYAIAKPEFMPIFDQLENRYTQYMAKTFIAIKGVYAKNLFRIFAKNYKGHCNLSKDDFVHAMGIPASYGTSKIINVIDKAIKELAKKQIYNEIIYTKIIGPGKGSPVIGFDFSYTKGDNLPDIGAMVSCNSLDQEKLDNNSANTNLICPFCGDNIVRSYNKTTKEYFYTHRNWKKHKDCPLKNTDTIDQMLIAIEKGKNDIKAKKEKAKSKKISEIPDLPDDFDPSNLFSGICRIPKNDNDCNNADHCSDAEDPPFPVK